jgi:hypothetical protein
MGRRRGSCSLGWRAQPLRVTKLNKIGDPALGEDRDRVRRTQLSFPPPEGERGGRGGKSLAHEVE